MEYVELLMIALASASISFTISTTSIFLWLRELVSPLHHKIEELIHCPWCLSHYVSLFFLAIFMTPRSFTFEYCSYFILAWFSVQGVVALLHYVYLRAYEPVAISEARRHINKQNKK